MILTMALMLLGSDAAAAIPSAQPVQIALAEMTEPDPKKMSQSEIRAHNAKLPRDHPYFIRCVKREDIGSLVKRNFSCRTNQQWTAAENAGNDEARAIADEMASKAWRTSN